MALVIKSLGTTAPQGAKKLYRDALVEEGSLFLVDFSNKGTLINFDITNGAPVFDLSREASNELGVNTQGSVITGDDLTLTEGKGFYPERNLPSGGGQGVFFGNSLHNYLEANQPKCVFIIWGRATDSGGDQLVRSLVGSDPSGTNIRINANSGGAIISTLAGASSVGVAVTTPVGNLFQVAIEFRGAGLPNKVYLNGTYLGEGTNNATGFVESSDLGIGKIEPSNPNPVVYRMLMEDLDVSGRTALEVVQKDYDYVHALGEFEGIEPRPFVDKF